MLFPSLRTTKKLFLTKPSFPGVLFSVLNGSNFFVQTLKLDCLKKKKKVTGQLAFGYRYHPSNLYTWTCFSIYYNGIVDKFSHIQQFFIEDILKPHALA